MTDIDWHGLFVRYVSHVSAYEGTHFLIESIGETEAEREAIAKVIADEEASWGRVPGQTLGDIVGGVELISTPFLDALSRRRP